MLHLKRIAVWKHANLGRIFANPYQRPSCRNSLSAPITLTVTGSAASGANVYYIQTDQLNTPRVITDQANALVWKWESDPFGMLPPNETPVSSARFTFNPRFPGQYFDKETNLHYNYYRDYDPQAGRYVQSDPIGLKGGINTYLYADGSPVAKTDPMGLATYMCTQPLHALGATGRILYTYQPASSPLYHQFIGIIRPNGAVVTGGQDRASGPWGPGAPSKGDGSPDSGVQCKKAEDDNECIEQCLMKAFSGPRPSYALTLSEVTNSGQNCQGWANNTLDQCQRSCKAKK